MLITPGSERLNAAVNHVADLFRNLGRFEGHVPEL